MLIGRSLSDPFAAILCTVIINVTGLAIGWRDDAGAGSVVAAFGLSLLFRYALSWLMACIGLAEGRVRRTT
jgi:ABC-2 type transport system permease protein